MKVWEKPVHSETDKLIMKRYTEVVQDMDRLHEIFVKTNAKGTRKNTMMVKKGISDSFELVRASIKNKLQSKRFSKEVILDLNTL